MFILATTISWYGMMVLHEAGHCAGAWLSGGAVARVDIPLLGFSQTRYRANPHPLFTAWAGPASGSLVSLLLLAGCRFPRGRKVIQGNVQAGLPDNGSQGSRVDFGMVRNSQCLAFAIRPQPTQLHVATPLGVDFEAE